MKGGVAHAPYLRLDTPHVGWARAISSLCEQRLREQKGRGTTTTRRTHKEEAHLTNIDNRVAFQSQQHLQESTGAVLHLRAFLALGVSFLFFFFFLSPSSLLLPLPLDDPLLLLDELPDASLPLKLDLRARLLRSPLAGDPFAGDPFGDPCLAAAALPPCHATRHTKG